MYLHGAAGDWVRDRYGDAGLLASDLPEGLAVARKRLASLAGRRQGAKGLGFGSRERMAATATAAPPSGTDPASRT